MIFVMPGLVPGIHVLRASQRRGWPGRAPAMTCPVTPSPFQSQYVTNVSVRTTSFYWCFMKEYTYRAQFEPGDRRGTIVVTFPDVPEVVTQGRGRADARTMAEEALGLVLLNYLEHRQAAAEAARQRPRSGRHLGSAGRSSQACRAGILLLPPGLPRPNWRAASAKTRKKFAASSIPNIRPNYRRSPRRCARSASGWWSGWWRRKRRKAARKL